MTTSHSESASGSTTTRKITVRLGSPFQLASRYRRFEPYKHEYEAQLHPDSDPSISSHYSPLANVTKSTEVLGRMNHGNGKGFEATRSRWLKIVKGPSAETFDRQDSLSVTEMAADLSGISLAGYSSKNGDLAGPAVSQRSRRAIHAHAVGFRGRDAPQHASLLLSYCWNNAERLDRVQMEIQLALQSVNILVVSFTHMQSKARAMPESQRHRCPPGNKARTKPAKFLRRRCPHGVLRKHDGPPVFVKQQVLLLPPRGAQK
ncbi:hypothetical protein DFH09DRAFT_1278665 [Mycena vulgaris]|nr:hypothetical protein DFH09DRAFT_1278665 [Mycena vulgaris]